MPDIEDIWCDDEDMERYAGSLRDMVDIKRKMFGEFKPNPVVKVTYLEAKVLKRDPSFRRASVSTTERTGIFGTLKGQDFIVDDTKEKQ